jgi:hypothetical protein
MRKLIQISPVETRKYGTVVFALADDGTAWAMPVGGNKKDVPWIPLPALPASDEEANRLTAQFAERHRKSTFLGIPISFGK